MSRPIRKVGQVWYGTTQEPHVRHVCVKFMGNGSRAWATALCGEEAEFWRMPHFSYFRHEKPIMRPVGMVVLDADESVDNVQNGCDECKKKLK